MCIERERYLKKMASNKTFKGVRTSFKGMLKRTYKITTAITLMLKLETFETLRMKWRRPQNFDRYLRKY